MAAATPQILTAQDEEAALVSEAPVRSRSVWRVVGVAAVASAVVVAGFLWSGSATMVGDKTTGLETVTTTYGAIMETGCLNWDKIQITRMNGSTTSVPPQAQCEIACNEDEDCTMYNYQKDPCEPGWFVADACYIFKGECQPTANTCWSLHYKFISSSPL